MDAATAAAIAALVVACAALIIAFAQVILQYLQTGQLIRLCDSVVYGPMPGQGHRRWITTQFRFRIIYSIPQICVDPDAWPEGSPSIKSFNRAEHALHELDLKSSRHEMQQPKTEKGTEWDGDSSTTTGEASWVSFSRVIQEACGRSVYYDLVEHDADRCPLDLPNVPMQVSMRDVLVTALFAGMECLDVSFRSGRLSMRGRPGSIITSQHPTLGAVVRFIPRPGAQIQSDLWDDYNIDMGVSIERRWILRALDYLQVSGDWNFYRRRRRITQRTGAVWTRYTPSEQRKNTSALAETSSIRTRRGEGRVEVVVLSGTDGPGVNTRNGDFHVVQVHPRDGWWNSQDLFRGNDAASRSATAGFESSTCQRRTTANATIKRTQTHLHVSTGTAASTSGAKYSPPRAESVSSAMSYGGPGKETLSTRVETAQEKQAVRRAKMQQMDHDRKIVNDLVTRGLASEDHGAHAQIDPYINEERLLLTQGQNEDSDNEFGDNSARHEVEPEFEPKPRLLITLPAEVTDEEKEAENREQLRIQQRNERDRQRSERYRLRNRNMGTGDIDWYWMSQVDIFHGPWATPWNPDILDSDISGGIAVVFEALLGFFDQDSILYGNARRNANTPATAYPMTAKWMLNGNYTCPSYAVNAKGGIIAPGTLYLIQTSAFKAKIPALELLYSYNWQRNPQDQIQGQNLHSHNLNVELMRLDAWLSYVGRLPEIVDGRSKLLTQAPALCHLVIDEFRLEFSDIEIDLSATEGGLPEIQLLAENVMDFLMDENLSEAEQVFTLVACLRTLKVARQIYDGPFTGDMQEVLEKDTQIYFV